MSDKHLLSRRRVLEYGSGLLAIAMIPAPALAAPTDADAAHQALFGDRAVIEGRVLLKVPPISENGYSVPLSVEVDSPMTENDHVVRIAIFSEENPLPDVARFELGPRAGKARIDTRIRLGNTQKIRAVVEMNDGALYGTSTFSIVTLAACVL
jgi:sulfur-oxidizing protein SoxY